MLKNERQNYILEKLRKDNSILVSDIVNELNVSDMTVRRDLSELETEGVLRRVYGGAVPVNKTMNKELSHEAKKIINIKEKNSIAEIANQLIAEGDIIFLGPGTTIEILAEKINCRTCLIVTNCLPVFKELNSKNIKSYLIGGEMRQITEAFNGEITISVLEKLKFHKAFFSCNGVVENRAMTATMAEGKVQALALNNSNERYLLIDSEKIGRDDFYTYYDLRDLTAVITNDDDDHSYQQIEKYTHTIINEI